jgi:anti-anti-sigma factor
VVHADEHCVTLRVSGELDGPAWPCLERALLSCVVVEVDSIVLDLTAVTFVSVGAFRHLHRVLDALRRDERTVEVEPSRALTRLISLAAAMDGISTDHLVPPIG